MDKQSSSKINLTRRFWFMLLLITALFISSVFVLLGPERIKNAGLYTYKYVYRSNETIRNQYKYCYSDDKSVIIFLHLSNESTTWKPLEICAFKTAAILNNETGVCVLTKGLMERRPDLSRIPNLEIVPFNINLLVENTTVSDWYENYVQNPDKSSPDVLWELSDALRFVYLYKYGGRYMDTDVLTLRNFGNFTNVMAWEDQGFINGAVSFFEKGHPFMRVALDKFMENFVPGVWGSVGPRLITKIHHSKIVDNQTYKVLEPKFFHPVHYSMYNWPFDPSRTKTVKTMTKDAFTLHLWRRMFKGTYKPWKAGSPLKEGSLVQEIWRNYCS